MWRREKGKTQPQSGRVQLWVIHHQRKLASWLQIQSEKLSITAKKVLLVTGCLLFAGCLVLQITGGLNHNRMPESGSIIKPGLPVPFNPMETAPMRAWRNFIDSLKRTPEGRVKLDSLIMGKRAARDSTIK